MSDPGTASQPSTPEPGSPGLARLRHRGDHRTRCADRRPAPPPLAGRRFASLRARRPARRPVEFSLSYRVVWNGFKKMVADFTPDERDAMLRGTAALIYRL